MILKLVFLSSQHSDAKSNDAVIIVRSITGHLLALSVFFPIGSLVLAQIMPWRWEFAATFSSGYYTLFYQTL